MTKQKQPIMGRDVQPDGDEIAPRKPANRLTQMAAAKRDRNALRYFERHNYSEEDVIKEVVKDHAEPQSAQAYLQAAGMILANQQHIKGEAHLHNARVRLEAKAKGAKREEAKRKRSERAFIMGKPVTSSNS